MAERRDIGEELAAPADEGDRQGQECPFCSRALRDQAVARRGEAFAVPDARPVTEGHMLVVTVRHTRDFFTMTPAERRDADELLADLQRRVLREDPTVTGFNVGCNCGQSAGQRIMHAHIHFIPRRGEGSDGKPVKGVIRNKMAY
jgi:diadenosine tetraphosphate (Ap4A) HIT family hydrolase